MIWTIQLKASRCYNTAYMLLCPNTRIFFLFQVWSSWKPNLFILAVGWTSSKPCPRVRAGRWHPWGTPSLCPLGGWRVRPYICLLAAIPRELRLFCSLSAGENRWLSEFQRNFGQWLLGKALTVSVSCRGQWWILHDKWEEGQHCPFRLDQPCPVSRPNPGFCRKWWRMGVCLTSIWRSLWCPLTTPHDWGRHHRTGRSSWPPSSWTRAPAPRISPARSCILGCNPRDGKTGCTNCPQWSHGIWSFQLLCQPQSLGKYLLGSPLSLFSRFALGEWQWVV